MKLYNSKSTLECDAQLIFILVNPHYKLTKSISIKNSVNRIFLTVQLLVRPTNNPKKFGISNRKSWTQAGRTLNS